MTQEELKNYLEAQAELGSVEIFFDEPWELPKKQKPVVSNTVVSKPSPSSLQVQEPIKPPVTSTEPLKQSIDFSSIKGTESQNSNEFGKVISLEELYVNIAFHSIYQGKQIFKGQGKENPKIFMLLDSPKLEDFSAKNWQEMPVGQMLSKMFSALSINAEDCYFSFMYKAFSERHPSPLLDNTLRQILQKEIALVKPDILVIFGELAMRQALGRDKSLKTIAGEPLQFAGTKTVVLHDAREMLSNVALKRETWSNHIPKSGLFKQ